MICWFQESCLDIHPNLQLQSHEKGTYMICLKERQDSKYKAIIQDSVWRMKNSILRELQELYAESTSVLLNTEVKMLLNFPHTVLLLPSSEGHINATAFH